MAEGSIRYLEEKGIKDTVDDFKKSIQTFQSYVKDMGTNTATLLKTWDGKGRNQFETQYTLLNGKLTDISDILYEIYEGLVDAESAYIDADQAVAKQINVSTVK